MSQQDIEVTDVEIAVDATEGGQDDGRSTSAGAERPRVRRDIAADYLEGLLDIADIDGDIDMDVEGDRAIVSAIGATLNSLSAGTARCWTLQD